MHIDNMNPNMWIVSTLEVNLLFIMHSGNNHVNMPRQNVKMAISTKMSNRTTPDLTIKLGPTIIHTKSKLAASRHLPCVIWMKFGTPMQTNMLMMIKKTQIEPEVEFQHG